MTTQATAPGLVCPDARLLRSLDRLWAATSPEDLAEATKSCLREILPLDCFDLVLREPSTGCLRRLAQQKNEQFPMAEFAAAAKCVLESHQVCTHASELPVTSGGLLESGIRSFAFVPLAPPRYTERNSGIGVLGIGSRQILMPGQIEWVGRLFAPPLAAAAEYLLGRMERDRILNDRDTARVLYEVARMLVRPRELSDLFVEISTILHPLLQPDYVGLAVRDRDAGLRSFVMDFPEGKAVMREEKLIAAGPSLAGTNSARPILISSLGERGAPHDLSRLLLVEGLNSACFLPLTGNVGPVGTLSFGSVRANAFAAEHSEALGELVAVIGMAIENASGRQRIARLRGAEPIKERAERPADREMIGAATGLRAVLETIRLVAPTDATVLLLGETGTGKELLARTVHEMSERRERNFVTINCTATPAGLLESELFGHEKGAFTGAYRARPGRFELAHEGTLFLDEVGDIPLELQPKLLRVLQESEFERLGGSRTMRVNVRIVAATNRDLLQLTHEGRFRSDLYYRLNVIPVRVPSLRERSGDIPELVSHFMRKYAERFRKPAETADPSTLEALRNRRWPGNVRELENLIERAVILSRDRRLTLPPGEGAEHDACEEGNRLKNAENEMIRRALAEANGVIGGPNGAAARLGMKRSTLQSKLKKLM